MKYADILASTSVESANQLWQQRLAKAPQDAELLEDYAFWLKHLVGDCVTAREVLAKAVRLAPSKLHVQWRLALLELKLGDFANGWRRHEVRWQVDTVKRDEFAGSMWPADMPLQAMAGKTVLLWPEQGLGDVLQFCRYALLVQRAGAKVYLQVPKNMQPLIAHSFDRLMPDADEIGDIYPLHVLCYEDTPKLHYDFHASLMSLPLHCGTDDVAKTPSFDAYLFADAHLQALWRDYMSRLPLNGKLKVGLVWAGGQRPQAEADSSFIDARRSLALEQFRPLLQNQKAQFFSLQKGEPASQLYKAAAQDEWFGRIIDCDEAMVDWSHTAALVANLDLVVTCDTSVAHLTGAMGKPVWVLSRFDGCWRWLVDRTDSPWYPSMRLFHQKEPHNWQSVMNEVHDALDLLTQTTAPRL